MKLLSSIANELIIALCFGLALLSLIMTGCTSRCETAGIKAVGGCDAKGLCAVEYHDLTFGREEYPIPGQHVTRCR